MSDSTVWGLILPVLSGPVKKAFYNSYSRGREATTFRAMEPRNAELETSG